MPATNAVYGYTDRLSYAPGDRVRVHVNVDRPTAVDVQLVELTGDDVISVPWSGAGTFEALPQEHSVGSFAVVDQAFSRSAHDFTCGIWFWPTAPDLAGRQTLLAVDGADGRGLVLAVEGGDVVAAVDGPQAVSTQVRAGAALRSRTWYFATVEVTQGSLTVRVSAVGPNPVTCTGHGEAVSLPHLDGARVSLAGGKVARVDRTDGAVHGSARDLFNGKLEAPFLVAGRLSSSELARAASGDTTVAVSDVARVLGAWDFAPARPGNDMTVRGVAGSPDGLLVNLPARGVTGVGWSGSVTSFVHAPEQYAAVHFHDDALSDVGWSALLEASLPHDLPSALYGIVLRAEDHTDVVPVTLVPAPESAPAPILVVLPVFTYLAYANEHMFEGDVSGLRADIRLDPRDAVRVGRPEYGLSQYDRHSDGTGVFFSSAARAILTMRADYEMWLTESGRGYSGDMYLLRWLRGEGCTFDVVTDLEVHQQGHALLSRYAVVVTGAHPEYTSAEMNAGLQAYRDSGGNLMYLGGNGFYQATGVLSESPLITEIRRGNAGVRGWDSEPGEVTLLSSGEPAGLWRHRGRAPQALVGVGFCAQGWDRSSPYRRSAASYADDVSWIFDGVEGDVFGSVGLVRGGAAGDEIDRADTTLGTPPGTVVLASSFGHSDEYQRAIEELGMNLPGLGGGTTDPEVRADVTYTPVPGGGAVFSVGSIAWTGALVGKEADPGVVAVTRNVLRRFAAASGRVVPAVDETKVD
ncbi:hypothetical protein E4P40_11670 [Blastococcus sp. CT_GayMR20]|uniref:N,N-dimethylformamidase beta subunit family domain-containing protein n=1 Tax=Blastococcus sp. CT_GayMR20 TaxID=2559609 RepID=UPI001073BAC0|nr:N,N-dimethylformamidase beta subunit family domain-containing protein [Blastococcus sp. CT_GayMR20]TFV87258.1 hypothetical protein E4P40_11555 [Blastococcus sp. CT_GayMR20]TFV87281.1 hypothetical protein E4P40_11670 [Blastococcus sp. CT_GayMR20]